MKEIISSLCFKNVLIEWIDGAKVEFDGKYFFRHAYFRAMLILTCHRLIVLGTAYFRASAYYREYTVFQKNQVTPSTVLKRRDVKTREFF